MLSIAVLGLLMLPSNALHPPFRIAWEARMDGFVDQVDPTNKVILLRSFDGGLTVLDLDSGKTKWHRKPTTFDEVLSASIDKTSLRVIVRSGKKLTYAIRTGELLADQKVYARENQLAQWNDIYIVEQPKGTLTAIDQTNRIVQWRYAVPGTREQMSTAVPGPIVEVGGKLFFGIRPKGSVCLDAKTGIQINYDPVNSYERFGLKGNQLYGDRKDCGRIDPQTGKTLWKSTDRGLYVLYANEERCIAEEWSKNLYCFDSRSGKLIWKKNVRAKENKLCSIYADARGIFVLHENDIYIDCYDLRGNRKWHYCLGASVDRIVATTPKGFIGESGNRLVRFEMGMPEALPTTKAGRRKLAAKLIAHCDTLSIGERRTMQVLGSQSVQAFFDHIRTGIKEKSNPSDPLYEAFMRRIPQLLSPSDSPMLVSLYRDAIKKPETNTTALLLLQLMEKAGDDLKTAPVFLHLLKRDDSTWKAMRGMEYLALRVVSRSRSQAAVSYLLDQLRDSKASTQIRRLAYCSLPATGGKRARSVVLKMRDRDRTVPSLAKLMQLEQIPQSGPISDNEVNPRSLFPIRTTPNGQKWISLFSSVIGSGDDIWIARSDGKNWAEPLYIGVDGSPINDAHTGEVRLDEAWSQFLTESESLKRDSDRDGLTDLVEKRLGTNPNQRDTDGDGIPDGVDKNPLAGRQPSTDEEKIIAAAFEAHFKFTFSYGPALVKLPQGMKPFELYGFDGYTVAIAPNAYHPFEELFGRGITSISFFDGGGSAIRFNPAKTEATVSMSVGYGPMNGGFFTVTLRRTGKDWIVVQHSQNGSA